MATAQNLGRRITATEDLQSVVRTMKGLAAVNVRQYQKAVVSLTEYTRTIELAFQALLRAHPQRFHETWTSRPHRDRKRCDSIGLVVFGSDQGMCGGFNKRLATHAMQVRDELAPGRVDLLAIGVRLATELEVQHLAAGTTLTLPSSVGGLTGAVDDVLLHVDSWRRKGVDRVVLLHHAPSAKGASQPRTVTMLPLATEWLRELRVRPWPTRALPMVADEDPGSVAALVRQHLFLVVYRAFAESLAAENAARLAAMQGAERNIEEQLQRLQHAFRQQRQAAITEELLDVISGSDALQRGANRHVPPTDQAERDRDAQA